MPAGVYPENVEGPHDELSLPSKRGISTIPEKDIKLDCLLYNARVMLD
jgi:hypothetical protein